MLILIITYSSQKSIFIVIQYNNTNSSGLNLYHITYIKYQVEQNNDQKFIYLTDAVQVTSARLDSLATTLRCVTILGAESTRLIIY